MKKLLTAIIAAALVMTAFLPSALAADVKNVRPATVASATAGTGGSGDPMAPFTEGSGLSADPYIVRTASQLAAVADAVEVDSDLCFRLAADIDLKGVAFTPIGSYTFPYGGTFDGAGHTVSNLTIKESGKSQLTAMFRASTGTIKSLVLKNVNIKNTNATVGYAAGIVGWNYGAVGGCRISGAVRVYAKANSFINGAGKRVGAVSFAAGAVAINSGRIKNCINTAKITAYKAQRAAGIAGMNGSDNSSARIESCMNKGIVYGGYSGGMAAYNEGGFIFRSNNKGVVTGKKIAGGIAAVNLKNSAGTAGSVRSCMNLQKAVKGRYRGGIVGFNNTGCIVYKNNVSAKKLKLAKIGGGYKVLV